VAGLILLALEIRQANDIAKALMVMGPAAQASESVKQTPLRFTSRKALLANLGQNPESMDT
jgi:hypothetical protein